MKKNLTFYSIVSILLSISFLSISCKKKSEEKNVKEQDKIPGTEISVSPQEGFSETYYFPNQTFRYQKDTLPNGDVKLRSEIFFKGNVPDKKALYDVTLYVDYYQDINIESCKFVVTAISPDGNSKRTQQYKIVFNDITDTLQVEENGRILKRNTRIIFPGMSVSSIGQFKVEMYPAGGRFDFTGIKSMTLALRKVKE